MRAKRLIAAAIVASTTMPLSVTTLCASPLVIDNESVPLSVVDAFGRTMFDSDSYCPPLSDQFVLDSFVKQQLLANKSDAEKQTILDQSLQPALKPHLDKLEKLHQLIKQESNDKRVGNVYKKIIARTNDEIKKIKRHHKLESKRAHRPSRHHQRRLRATTDVSAADKNYIRAMLGKVSHYTQHIKSSITDEDVETYYQLLVQKKDKRLVDVHLFKYRHLLLTSIDQQTVDRATDLLIKDERPPGMSDQFSLLITPEGSRLIPGAQRSDKNPLWSTLDTFDQVQKDPSKITAGATLFENAGPIGGPYLQSYRLLYIYDKKIHPLILLNDDSVRESPASFLRQQLYEDRMRQVIESLRSDAVVTLNGKEVIEATVYARCP